MFSELAGFYAIRSATPHWTLTRTSEINLSLHPTSARSSSFWWRSTLGQQHALRGRYARWLKYAEHRSFASKDTQVGVFSTMSAAFSPIIIDGALVLPDVSVGMIEASAT